MMKNKLVIVFLLVFIVTKLSAQNDSIQVRSSQQYYNVKDDYFDKITFKFGVGLFIPQGNLEDYFSEAPMFDFSFNFPLKKGKSLEATLQFVVPNQSNDFLYLRTIDTIRAKSTFMFNGALRLKKRLHTSKLSELNVSLGIGVSTIYTDARNPFYTGREGEKKYELISTLLLLPGIEWSHDFSESLEITFGLDFQYSPYKIEGALREEIGGLALIPKISCKF